MTHIKPILGLIVLTTLIPELFTASTPITTLLNPSVLWGYLIGYGVAILFLREVATHLRLSYGGIFLFGTVYSFFNEGFLAKTYLILTSSSNAVLPVEWLQNLGNFFGLNLGFTATSALWHGIGSVLIPICIIHYLFPKSATTPWLAKYLTVFLGALLAFIGINGFFSPEKIQGTIVPFLTIIFSMTFLSLFALKYRRRVDAFFDASVSKPVWPFLLGLSMGVFYYVVLNITAQKASPLLFMLILALGTFGYVRCIQKQKWNAQTALLFFGIGFYAQTLVIPLIFVPTTVNIVTSLVAYIILAVSYVGLRRRQRMV